MIQIFNVRMFYYTLTNIHLALRSRLQIIMLHIEKYVINENFKAFVSGMMELESVG